jgi:2'-5' RNA ligase
MEAEERSTTGQDRARVRPERWRTFVAVPLSEDVHRALGALRRSMPRRASDLVRWLEPSSIHLTLHFLGSIDPDQVGQISEGLGEAAARSGRFTLKLDGPGGFPSLRRPRVLWVGLSGETNRLKQLHGRVEGAVLKAGFDPEERGFQPHLTVGRIQERAPRGADWQAGEAFGRLNPFAADFEASRVVLFRSHLHSTGARYEELFSAPLR